MLNGVKNYNKIVLEYEVPVHLNVTKSILFQILNNDFKKILG